MTITFGKIQYSIVLIVWFHICLRINPSELKTKEGMFIDRVADSIICLCLVAILWGATNPFIKRGARGLENVKASSASRQFIKELAFLVTNLEVRYRYL